MQDSEGRTALMLAAESNSFNAVQLLKDEAGMQSREGESALMVASRNNSLESVQILQKFEQKMQDS